MECRACGTELGPRDSRCLRCGTPVDGSPAARRSVAKGVAMAGAVAVGIPIWWSQPQRIRNIADLRRNVRERGGSIRQYERLVSLLFFMRRDSAFEWVPPDGSPLRAGLKHVVYCLLLGWWSILGWMLTPAIVVNNLLGGVDVTAVLSTDQPEPLALEAALNELRRTAKRQQRVLVGTLLTIFIVVVLLVYMSLR